MKACTASVQRSTHSPAIPRLPHGVVCKTAVSIHPLGCQGRCQGQAREYAHSSGYHKYKGNNFDSGVGRVQARLTDKCLTGLRTRAYILPGTKGSMTSLVNPELGVLDTSCGFQNTRKYELPPSLGLVKTPITPLLRQWRKGCILSAFSYISMPVSGTLAGALYMAAISG